MAINKIRLIQFRRDSELGWNTNNPVLAAGEPGFNNDNGKIKVGNGIDVWTRLPYQESGFHVEQIKIDADLITRKNLSLQFVPSNPGETRVEVQGAGPQFYGVDYTVNGRTLQWSNLGMEMVLGLNRIIRVSYTA